MTLPNRHRGEVTLPGESGGRCIRFTIDVMEKLQAKYATEDNKDWVSYVFDNIGVPDISMIKTIVETARVGDEPIDTGFISDVPIIEVVDAIRDGLTLALHGKTVAEHVADLAKREEEELEKKVEKLKAMLEKKGIDPEAIDDVILSQ